MRVVGLRADIAIQNGPQMARSWTPASQAVKITDEERAKAVIITDATEFVGELHDRMPVILEPKQFQASLTGGAGLELLKPAANDLLQ